GPHGEPPQPPGPQKPVLVEQGHPRRGDPSPRLGRAQRRRELHRAGLDGRSEGDGATRGTSTGVGWHRHTVAAGPRTSTTGARTQEAIHVAWDFETEPEYEAKLAWARAFVDEEILPLETLELDYDDLLRVIGPLQ